MDLPRIINNFDIEFEVENSINKIELTKELDFMLPYLRKNLNNENYKSKYRFIEGNF